MARAAAPESSHLIVGARLSTYAQARGWAVEEAGNHGAYRA
ncbi:hypothetical protein WMF26_25005 [Sorangium sp. So ce185]